MKLPKGRKRENGKMALNNKTLKNEIETIKKGQAQGLPLQYVHDKHLRDEIETILPFSCVKCYLFRFSNLLPLFSFAHVKNECNRNQGRLWIGLSSPTVTRSSGQGCPSHRLNRIQSFLVSIGVLHFLLT